MFESTDGVLLKNNTSVICGITRDSNNIVPSRSFLIKLAEDGAIIWQKSLAGQGANLIMKLIQLQDGNLLVAADDRDQDQNPFFVLMKLDTAGHQLWRKSYPFTLGGKYVVSGLHEESDGSIILAGNYNNRGLTFGDPVLFMKMDPAGNLVFARSVKPAQQIATFNAYHSMIDGGYTYIAGSYADNNVRVSGAILKMRNSDGSLVWTKYYNYNNGISEFLQIAKYRNRDICLLGVPDINPVSTTLMLIVDTDGKVLNSSYFKVGDSRKDLQGLLDNNGNITWASNYVDFASYTSTFMLSKVDPYKGVLWSKAFPQLKSYPRTKHLQYGTDSSLFFHGYIGTGLYSSQLYYARVSPEGEAGCPPTILAPQFGSIPAIVQNAALQASTVTLQQTSRSWQELPGMVTGTDTLCKSGDNCTTLKLTANSTLCQQTDTLMVRIVTAAGCTLVPSFAYDRAVFRLLEQGAGYARFIPLKKGASVIHAVLAAACHLYEDSVAVSINQSTGKPGLGQDTLICPGTSLTLNAHAGYSTYLWQDGSADSVFVARTTGQYQVSVTDGCGNRFSDTIVLKPAPPFTIDLGQDLARCNQDTLLLSAPAGYAAYTWSPAIGLSASSGQLVKAYPAADTYYTVTVQNSAGCTAADSLKITVRSSPRPDLGKDSAVCAGDSMVLKPGGVYSLYQWSGGGRGSSMVVKKPGLYWLEVRDQYGCRARDSIMIGLTQCRVGFYMPNAFTPNGDGRNDVFRPVVWGQLVQYHLAVYNRWGQKVFESNDPQKGWDGTTHGVYDRSAPYVWICTYQLTGAPVQHEKGTVVLVH